MRQFKSIRHAQRFLSVHGSIANHFRSRRHRLRACHYREIMDKRFKDWRKVTGNARMVQEVETNFQAAAQR